MEVWDWIPFLQRRWRSIALVTVLTAAVTMAVSFVVPPTYQSTATLLVQPLTQAQPLGYSSAVELIARNAGELIKSPSVEKRAAGSLKKTKLEGKVVYRVLENSGLIQITVAAGSPELAAAEANAIADAFMKESAAAMKSASAKAQVSLDAQTASLKATIAETEAKMAIARTQANSAALVAELQDKLDSLNTAYQGVLQSSQQVPSSESAVSTALLLADKAVPEPKPVSPKLLLNLALSIVGGLLLGIAFARATESSSRGNVKGA
jgi:uncharacterized protein involved in exopolysaccharide biosynthesis